MVANNAFINQLFSHRIKLENLEVNGTTEHGAIYGGERYNADGEINDNSTEETQGFHLSSNGLLQANKAVLKGGYFEDIFVKKLSATNIELFNFTAGSITPKNRICACLRKELDSIKNGRIGYFKQFLGEGTITYNVNMDSIILILYIIKN